MNDLKFDIYAMVDPKTPADFEALWKELISELQVVHEIIDRINQRNQNGSDD